MKLFKKFKKNKEIFKVVYIDEKEYTEYIDKAGLSNLIMSCCLVGAEIKSVERI